MKTIIVYDGKVFEDLDAVLRESGVGPTTQDDEKELVNHQFPGLYSLEALEMEIHYAIVINKNQVVRKDHELWERMSQIKVDSRTGREKREEI